MTADRENDQEAIDRLIHDISYHQYRYQVLDDPVISDRDFDMLMAEFEVYQNKYPDLEIPIGVKDGEILHTHPMLSMRSSYDLEKVNQIIANMGECNIDWKLDGLAMEVKYNHGDMIIASTRGDGKYGNDVTAQAMVIPSIPHKVNNQREPVIVYGEVVLLKTTYHIINAARLEKGKRAYATCRNAASGILRSDTGSEMLVFVPYTVWEGDNMVVDVTGWCKMEGFDGWKLRTMWERVSILGSISSDIIEQALNKRPRLDIEVDGLVLYSENLKDRKRLGYSTKHPRWQIALKFPANVKISTLLGVEVNVGRTGLQAPTGIIEPVILMSKTINRATLSNYDVISEKDLRIGDKVYVALAKDVIPAILGVVVNSRTGAEKRIEPPDKCVCCGSKTFQDMIFDGKEFMSTGKYYCSNIDCTDRIIAKWIYLTGRGVLNIKGMGSSMIIALVNAGLLTSDISSLYRLADLSKRKKMKIAKLVRSKNWEKVIVNISKKKEIGIPMLFLLMDINHLSVGLATILSEFFMTVEDVVMRHAEILEIPITRFPDRVKKELLNFLAKRGDAFIKSLIKAGVSINEKKVPSVSYDKKAVITGRLDNMYRKDMISFMNEKGYHVTSNVAKDTSVLIVGEKPSQSKIDKANQYGITILTETAALSI